MFGVGAFILLAIFLLNPERMTLDWIFLGIKYISSTDSALRYCLHSEWEK